MIRVIELKETYKSFDSLYNTLKKVGYNFVGTEACPECPEGISGVYGTGAIIAQHPKSDWQLQILGHGDWWEVRTFGTEGGLEVKIIKNKR